MVKSELIDLVAQRADVKLSEAERAVETFFDAIVEALANGERVEIRGFGAFTVREYQGFKGRNPRTGEKIEVSPKRLPFWRCGLELKSRLDAKYNLKEVSFRTVPQENSEITTT